MADTDFDIDQFGSITVMYPIGDSMSYAAALADLQEALA